MSRFLNEDKICGHVWFDSAIQRSVEAKEKTRVRAGSSVKPDFAEAKRLLLVAISDAKMAIEDIKSDPKWFADAKHWVKHMEEQVSAWEGDVYTMP